MEILYQQIGETVNDMIPEDWKKVYIYAEVSEFDETVYFYYYPEEGEEPIYSLDIEDIFDIDEEELSDNEDHLDQLFDDLWNEFKNQHQKQWTSLTFVLESSGEMKIDYNYENLENADPVELKDKWMKKYLKD